MRLASRKPTALLAAIGLTSAASGFVAAGASVASIPARYGIDIQAIYSSAGNPSLIANFSPDGALAKPRWSICRPPDVNVCAQAHTGSQFLEAGPSPADTIFEATATYKGQTYVARTARWKGTLRAIAAPRLSGSPRVGATVAPHRAVWTDGWAWQRHYRRKDGLDSGGRGPDFDFLSVEACRTSDAKKCVNLSEPRSEGFSRRAPVVGMRFTGWYLFAFDQRFAADTAFAAPAYRTPASVPPLKAGATVARSAPRGPVVGPPVPGVSTARPAIAR
jgi:hypothetical protein